MDGVLVIVIVITRAMGHLSLANAAQARQVACCGCAHALLQKASRVQAIGNNNFNRAVVPLSCCVGKSLYCLHPSHMKA